MTSKVKNTIYHEQFVDIMSHNLRVGSFSDVNFIFQSSQKTIKCHKSILALASPFLQSLISDHDNPVCITLVDAQYDEVMALLNILYVGKIEGNCSVIQKAREAASKYFCISNLTTDKKESMRDKIAPEQGDTVEGKTKHDYVKTKSPRPLIMKPHNNTPHPWMFFISSLKEISSNSSKQNPAPAEEDCVVLNSYQRAKQRCADKFKCKLCDKAFPLSCLLQRHMKTHSDIRPYACLYCDKTFRSKAVLKQHHFMKHAGEKILNTDGKETSVGVISSTKDGNPVITNVAKEDAMKYVKESSEYLLEWG